LSIRPSLYLYIKTGIIGQERGGNYFKKQWNFVILARARNLSTAKAREFSAQASLFDLGSECP